MKDQNHTILAIETSCDETAAAVVVDGHTVLSNIVASQIPIHQRYGGVVPEVAARAHVEQMIPVIEQALVNAFVPVIPTEAEGSIKDFSTRLRLGRNDKEISPQDLIKEKIDAIAVTNGPGLIGSLLVGVNTARALSQSFNKPLIGVNHILGHLYANWIDKEKVDFPILTLVVSGGHSDLILSNSHSDHKLIGQTRDDAAGEAFDKAAQLLGLPYPGGPSISKEAVKGDPRKYDLPRAMSKLDTLDYSFSGLKTALKTLVTEIINDPTRHSGKLARPESKEKDPGQARMTVDDGFSQFVPNLSASFQAAVVDALVSKAIAAAQQYNVKQINLAGGVAANQSLRETLEAKSKEHGINFSKPDFQYCTDNAAMVGAAAYHATLVRENFNWYDVVVTRQPTLEL